MTPCFCLIFQGLGQISLLTGQWKLGDRTESCKFVIGMKFSSTWGSLVVFTIRRWLEASWTQGVQCHKMMENWAPFMETLKGINRKANVREGRNLPSNGWPPRASAHSLTTIMIYCLLWADFNLAWLPNAEYRPALPWGAHSTKYRLTGEMTSGE